LLRVNISQFLSFIVEPLNIRCWE